MSPPSAPDSNTSPARAVSAYGQEFWFAYLANTALMVAVSLLFRYGDFVAVLGGSELQLGWIVGIGAVGSLLMRLVQGAAVDRYGPRTIWLLSLAGVALMLVTHLAIQSAGSPFIYVVRTVYHTCLAGAFGASITYISLRAPVVRMAEIIGMLGSSGFVGMALGSLLGDALCGTGELARWHLDRLFLCAAGLAVFSFVSAWCATRHEAKPIQRRSAPLWPLVRRYHPGWLLLMGVVMGLALGLPGTFLRPYTKYLGISQIGWFFVTYSATAFCMRLATRRVPDRLGVRPTVLLGMAAAATGTLLYLVVHRPWQLMIPGVAVGAAHAMLFPAVVAGAGRAFPARNRGVGVALMLGMFDIGNLVGMPLVGTLLDASMAWGLPPYATTFGAVALLIVGCSAWYALHPQRRYTPTVRRPKMIQETSEPVEVG